MEGLKVLHIGKMCPPHEGGIEVFTIDLLESLNSKNVVADLMCFGNTTSITKYKNFKVYSCKLNAKVRSTPISVGMLKTFIDIVEDYDIIHIHSPNPMAEILSIFQKKPVVVHWHSDIVEQKFLYKLYRPIQRVYLKKSSKIIVTSPQYLQSSTQIKAYLDKSTCIPLGINPNRLVASINPDINEKVIKALKEGKKIILFVGRLVKYKGVEYLIEASKYVDDDVVIVIAGYGPLWEKLNEKVIRDGLTERVLLVGRVKNVVDYISVCHAFCLPSVSRNEAFGLVLLEAMYLGKPVITTNVYGSGMNFVNIDGITGIVVPPAEPRAIADAINKLCKDNSLYAYMSENAKRRALEFRIENIASSIKHIYKTII